MPVEGGERFLMLQASIASSPLHSTSHPSIKERKGGTDNLARSQRSNRASEWGRVRCEREKYRKTEHKSKTQLLSREVFLFSGYPPSPCLCFLHPCDSLHGPLASWPLCRLPFLRPALSLSSRLTCRPHWRVECRQRTLNLTPLL